MARRQASPDAIKIRRQTSIGIRRQGVTKQGAIRQSARLQAQTLSRAIHAQGTRAIPPTTDDASVSRKRKRTQAQEFESQKPVGRTRKALRTSPASCAASDVSSSKAGKITETRPIDNSREGGEGGWPIGQNHQTSQRPELRLPNGIAMPVTPPFVLHGKNVYACGVDYNRTEYQVQWSGSWQPPSLVGFPNIAGLRIEKASQSAERRYWWRASTLLDYGSYALVRVRENRDEFPVIKLAHDGDAKRLFIKNELNILNSLVLPPVVRVLTSPLSDANGIFGFQMQSLRQIELNELPERLNEVTEAVQMVHDTGIVINDVSVSNVMLDFHDHIKLIDFGFAGKIGTRVPAFFPSWKSKQPPFSVETDTEDLQKIIHTCNAIHDERRKERVSFAPYHLLINHFSQATKCGDQSKTVPTIGGSLYGIVPDSICWRLHNV